MQKTNFAPLICFFIFLFIYGMTSRSGLQVSDEIAVFSSGVSLATKRSISVDTLGWLQTDRVTIGHVGPDGHLYTKYFPGNILGIALIYNFTKKNNDIPFLWYEYFNSAKSHVLAESNYGARIALRWNALLGSIGIAALYAFLLRRFDWKTATVTVLVFGLCTDWWYQTRGLYSEIGAGTFLILCLYFADIGLPLWSSVSLGISLLFRPTNLLGVSVWVYGVWKKRFRQAWTGIFIILGFCGLLFYNWLRFKSFFDFGYTDEHFNSWIIEGLVGILFSPGRSLFFYSPILILSISGIRIFYSQDKALTGTLLSLIVAHILTVSTWHSWEGGESWGSRLITPMLPMLGIFIAPIIEKALSARPEKTRNSVLLLVLLGFGIQLVTLTANPFLTLVNYVGSGLISYSDTINSFQNSWLSLQIRNLEHWNVCNIDAYSLRQLFAQCR